MKEKFKVLLFNVGLLVVLLFGVELFLRLMGLGFGDEPLENHWKYHHVFPAEYRYIQYNLDQEFGGFEVYYDKNRRIANPSPGPGITERNDRPDILLLGDSFVVGKEVPWKSSFPAILQDSLPEFNIINLAVTSYSPSIYYLKIKDFLAKNDQNPAAVSILLYSNDVGNDSTYLKHAVHDQITGELIQLDGGKPNSIIQWLRKSYLARWIRKTQLTIAYSLSTSMHENSNGIQWSVGGYLEPRPKLANTATEFYLRKIVHLLTEEKVPYFISVVPSKYCHFNGITDSTSFDKRVEHWAAENQVPFLNLTPSFTHHSQTHKGKCFFAKDIHFNTTGHQIVANKMLAYLREACLIKKK